MSYVAREILNQLGGRRFLLMTGAKNLMTLKNDSGLSFWLPGTPGFVKNKINYVEIRLNDNDLYDVEYINMQGGFVKPVAKSNDIYNDMLVSDFEKNTGLATRL